MGKRISVDDFEAMILTSLLGVFVALREDLISEKQAECFWLSEFTAKMFEQLSLADEVIDLVQQGVQLKHYEQYSPQYYSQIDRLIASSKELINQYYTEYEETTGMLS